MNEDTGSNDCLIDIKPFERLQQQTSPIFSFMDIDYGKYFSQVHKNICVIANTKGKDLNCGNISQEPPQPTEHCPKFEAQFTSQKLNTKAQIVSIKKSQSMIKFPYNIVKSHVSKHGILDLIFDQKRIGFYSPMQQVLTQYKLPCDPIDIYTDNGNGYIICQAPFSFVSIKNYTPASFIQYKSGTWDNQHKGLTSHNIRPLSLNKIDDKLVGSAVLPSGDGINFIFSDSALFSISAQVVEPNCNILSSTLSIDKFRNGNIVGKTTDEDLSTRILASFDKNMNVLISVFNLDDVDIPEDIDFDTWQPPPNILACGEQVTKNRYVCIDEEGSLQALLLHDNKWQKKTILGQIPIPDEIHTAQICGGTNSIYVLLTTKNGFGSTELLKIENNQTSRLLFTEIGNVGYLDCSRNGIVGLLRDWEHSIVHTESQ